MKSQTVTGPVAVEDTILTDGHRRQLVMLVSNEETVSHRRAEGIGEPINGN